MFKLRLIKGRSYTGVLRATRENPFVETDNEEAARLAVASGYFELCGAITPGAPTPEPEPGNGDEVPPDYGELADMKKADLEAYAAENGVDITGCRTKADILEAISAQNGGSLTMIDLQRE